jgi:hypothetical protein
MTPLPKVRDEEAVVCPPRTENDSMLEKCFHQRLFIGHGRSIKVARVQELRLRTTRIALRRIEPVPVSSTTNVDRLYLLKIIRKYGLHICLSSVVPMYGTGSNFLGHVFKIEVRKARKPFSR